MKSILNICGTSNSILWEMFEDTKGVTRRYQRGNQKIPRGNQKIPKG